MNNKEIKALVFAQVNRELLEKELSGVTLTYKGYSETFFVMEPEEIVRIIADFDVLVCEFETINREVIDAASSLKMIICCRGGINTVVDVEYARSRGIIVFNTPGRNSEAVAEYVIGQIINLDRNLGLTNLLIQDNALQNRKYEKPKHYRDSLWGMDRKSPYHVFRGKGLRNITLGIIGYGNVGKVVCSKAHSLGMNVLVYDPWAEFIPFDLEAEFETVLSNSDVISLHCSNPNHIELFTSKEFKMMKKGAFFINTARGDLVDEEGLVECLKSGQLGAAVLDVTRVEPLPNNYHIVGVPNLFITPHIAGATDYVIDCVSYRVIEYIRSYVEGKYET